MNLSDLVGWIKHEGMGAGQLRIRRERHAHAEGIRCVPRKPIIPAHCYPPEKIELE